MLGDNIRGLRKEKGLSQDELAIKLNVVRQTVSKWERGLSVPDSGMLVSIADAFGISVNTLLDVAGEDNKNTQIDDIEKRLEAINTELKRRNEVSRKFLRIVFIMACVLSVCVLFFFVVGFIYTKVTFNAASADIAVIGGADGPTAIFVTAGDLNILPFITAVVVTVISAIGIYKTRKK